jgi:thiol:disulfide interchange protein DsbC
MPQAQRRALKLSQTADNLGCMMQFLESWRARLGVALVLMLALSAAAAAAAAKDPIETVRSSLHTHFPKLKIQDVRASAIPGWYEVFTGSQLLYSDASGDHVFVGKLIDTHTQKDLAEEQLENRLTIDFQKLPFDRAIKIVKGDGSRRLALFEDPDCPFCRQLEQQLASVNNVTLYVFLFPIVELHPKARVHAHAIWCAADRGDAWTHWMLERREPGSSECQKDPIDQLQTLGTDLNVTGTPTYFLDSGRRYEGVLTASQLDALLNPPAKAAPAAGQSGSAVISHSGDGS